MSDRLACQKASVRSKGGEHFHFGERNRVAAQE